MEKPRRVLLKLSGEALGNEKGEKFCWEKIRLFMEEVSEASKIVEVAVVVGGGNIFRGVDGQKAGMERTSADYLGMLATIQNGLALRNALVHAKCSVRLMSAIPSPPVAEPWIRLRAVRHLEKKRVVILSGGTGNPFCSTDYAAALRANELSADLVVKATNVDGVYSDDPHKNPEAVRLTRVTFEHCVQRRLRVMDSEAFLLCQDQKMPIRVISLLQSGNIYKALTGEDLGSLVTDALPLV